MKTLTEIKDEFFKKEYANGGSLSTTNIDDVLWYARALGVTELIVRPMEMRIIWIFLMANVPASDHKQLLIDGGVPRLFGINLNVQPDNSNQEDSGTNEEN
jgi:hypothetical protein